MSERAILRKYGIKPLKYTKNKSVKIVDTKDNRYVIKKKKNSKEDLFEYLSSRSFLYFPKLYNGDSDDRYEIYEYIEENNIPKEQKAIDLIYLMTLLHSKTTHYKELDKEDYKIIYEEKKQEIKDKKLYYIELNNLIDEVFYMSPSQYLLVRNISKIYAVLNYVDYELDNWYSMIKNKTKERVSMLHNNLSLDHLIRNNENYLISWDNYKIDNPIYDIYHFYKNNYSDVNFSDLLKIYESKYPLHEDERMLLFILISIPPKIEFDDNEYENTTRVNQMINYILKTDKLISPYYSKQEYEKENNF